MDVRRRAPKRARDDLDEAEEAELADDDARQRKLITVSTWQIFLFHRRVPDEDEKVS